MLATIQKVFAVVMAVLGALSATGTVNVSSIAPILSKIVALLGSLSNLTPATNVDATIADLVAALGDLKASGLIHDTSALDEALSIIGKYTATVADYKSGQAALIDANFSFDGVPGDLIAVSKGGAAAQSLGL